MVNFMYIITGNRGEFFFSFFVVHFMPETKFFCVWNHVTFYLNNDPSFNIPGQTLVPGLYHLKRCKNLLNSCDDNAHKVLLSVVTI